MVISHNLLAKNSNRMLGITNKKNAKATEKLSSGYRINRSADDAAGLAISEKMRRQIRGLTQASANAQDGISLIQTAEGAMEEVHGMLQRANELAVKAATGTLSDDDRAMVDAEYQQLKDAIDGVASTSTFNNLRLFPDNGNNPNTAASSTIYKYSIQYNLANGNVILVDENDNADGVTTITNANTTNSVLAQKIADEFVPNAIKQILDKFPSLKALTGSDVIEMGLEIEAIDGANGTLAYAQYAYYNTAGSRPVNMLIRVDTSDFTDADAQGTGANAEVLESTLAHELMHSVMQYNLTDGMSGRAGETYPDWFVEGTAQLAGGGYTTGWNDQLMYYAEQMSGANDTSQDANIKTFLQSYTIAGRPYGHGYLASAYIGYLASGSSSISDTAIAAGMDKIFETLGNGTSLNDAIQNLTGKSFADINSLFTSGDQTIVDFVRDLTYASIGGAGSVVAGGLDKGGTSIIGTGAGEQAFRIATSSSGGTTPTPTPTPTPNPPTPTPPTSVNSITLQVGADAGQIIQVNMYKLNTEALGMDSSNVATTVAASAAITEVDNAIQAVSRVRSYYGAIQNRLEHTIKNLDNVVENTTAAESAIRDTDMAKTMVEYSLNNILQQAGQTMLTQANQQPQYILGLFQ